MSEYKRNMIDYIVVCVNDFADAHRMDCVAGFDYLREHGGIAFLEANYDIEHTYSIDVAVSDLVQVCRRNGGNI